jgi:hypothetical protein
MGLLAIERLRLPYNGEYVTPMTGFERRAQKIDALTRLGGNPVVPSSVSQKRETEQTGNQMDDLSIGLD